jgi:hypothetical protein
LKGPADLAVLSARLPSIFLADPKSSERFWEFFAANIRNQNTRRAYYKAACRFKDSCEERGLFHLPEVSPPLLRDRVLLPEMESEWHNYQTVAKIAATLRKRLLQGGLAIFEGAFEVGLESREGQLSEIKQNLRAQLQALSPRVFVRNSANSSSI